MTKTIRNERKWVKVQHQDGMYYFSVGYTGDFKAYSGTQFPDSSMDWDAAIALANVMIND